MRRLLFLLALRGCCALPSRLADDDHATLEPGDLESAQLRRRGAVDLGSTRDILSIKAAELKKRHFKLLPPWVGRFGNAADVIFTSAKALKVDGLETLGLPETATAAEIEQKYEELLRTLPEFDEMQKYKKAKTIALAVAHVDTPAAFDELTCTSKWEEQFLSFSGEFISCCECGTRTECPDCPTKAQIEHEAQRRLSQLADRALQAEPNPAWVPHKPLFDTFLAPVRNDPISSKELTFRARVREEVDGQKVPRRRDMYDIVVKASDAPGGMVQLFDGPPTTTSRPLWTWKPDQGVPALKPTSASVSLSFTKSFSLGSKRVTQVMTLSAPNDLEYSTRPLGLTLLHKLLTELRDGELPAEPSHHLGYLIRLEEFRAAGTGVTKRKEKLPSRPNAPQPMLGVELGKKIGFGGEGQVFLAAPQQRAWDKLEAGARVANYAVVVDGQGLYGSNLHRAPPVIFKQSYSTMMGKGFDYTEVKQFLKLMAHEFVGRTVPPGASHIVRMYGRLVSTKGEDQEGMVFEQMTGDLTVLTKALPAYSSAVDTAVRDEAARQHGLEANLHPDVAELIAKIHRRRLGVVRIAMQTLDGLRQAALPPPPPPPLPCEVASEHTPTSCRSFLHSRGAAHLDLKEDNVMYRMLPERKVLVKLIDVGLMQWKRRDAEPLMIQSTDEAANKGTLDFLSPARLAAFDAHKCIKEKSCPVVTFDAQKDDVWAVGLMLLSMLSPGTSRRGRKLLAPYIENKRDGEGELLTEAKKTKEYLKINNEEWRTLVAEAVSSKRAELLQDVKRSVNALVRAPLMMSGKALPNPHDLSEFGKRLQLVLKGMLEPDEAARFTAAEAYNKLLMLMTSAGPYGLQDPVEGLEDDGDLRDAIEAASRVA